MGASLAKKKRAGGTINSYLGSMQKFITFVTSDRRKSKGMSHLDQETIDIFKFLKTRLPGWRTTVKKESQVSMWKRYGKECDEGIKPEDLKNLTTSKPAVLAIEALDAAQAGQHLSGNEFTAARDIILTSRSLQNGTQPGALNNATIDDVQTGRVEEVTGKLVLPIAKHKRVQAGPAMLCMNKQLHDWLQIYLHKIRPQFALKDKSALFIKVTGDAFPEGTIGKRITAFFSKAGIRQDIRVSSTRIRKLISSTVHEHDPENAAKVRKLMAHSQKTAELSYVRSSLTQTAPAAHEVVSTVLGASSSSSVARSLTAKEKDAIDLQFHLFITLNKKVCLKDVQHLLTKISSCVTFLAKLQGMTNKCSIQKSLATVPEKLRKFNTIRNELVSSQISGLPPMEKRRFCCRQLDLAKERRLRHHYNCIAITR